MNPISQLLYAVAGIVALLGTIDVYICMNNDDGRAKKIILWTMIIVIVLVAEAQMIDYYEFH